MVNRSNHLKGFFAAFILSIWLLPLSGYAQGNISIPARKPASVEKDTPAKTGTQTNPESKGSASVQKSTAKVTPSPAKQSISIRLRAVKDGTVFYFTPKEWEKLTAVERARMNKVGMVIGSGDNAFLLSLYDNTGRKNYSESVPYEHAYDRTGGQMPSKSQWQTIKNNKTAINNALTSFGGDNLSSNYYWCQDGSYINNGTSASFDKSAKFRICTDDIDGGFSTVTVNKPGNVPYDFVGIAIPNWGNGYLTPVGYHGKYGFVNKEGALVIPLIFDDIYCITSDADKMNKKKYWNGESWMSVMVNGQWGYIDSLGNQVIFPMYDFVDSEFAVNYQNTGIKARVVKEGLVGAISTTGKLVMPIEYEYIDNYQSSNLFCARKDKKYGFYDSSFSLVIPHRYDHASVFNSRGICAVGNNGRYGYINTKGDTVIPLRYEFAGDFCNGLAAVVKDGKLGYINEKGEEVIPCQYGVSYSTYLRSRFPQRYSTKDLYLGSNFSNRPYAFVIGPDGKLGMISEDGKLRTDFKYDSIISSSTDGTSTAVSGKKKIFLDYGGNEYSSEEERKANSTKKLAEQGYPSAIRYFALEQKNKKEYQKAEELFRQAYEKGSFESAYDIGIMYYYGNIDSPDRYKTALEWFLECIAKADSDSWVISEAYDHIGYIYYNGGYGVSRSYADARKYLEKSSEKAAKYLLGWMYEYGQGVRTDKAKAISYYKECLSYKDAQDRIRSLEK